MSNIVIGLGQIGSAIQNILECDGYDIRQPIEELIGTYEIVHVCFPYSDKFEQQVNFYKDELRPRILVIHSTVKVGTSQKLGAVYSPCRGVHPFLEKGIRTFDKFFAGVGSYEIAKMFSDKIEGECIHSNDSASLEAAKLWDTEQYREAILLEKKIHLYCEENKLDFNTVYTLFNETYNSGYEKLGMPQYKKYVLKHVDGPIGGHCVEPNHHLLYGTVSDT